VDGANTQFVTSLVLPFFVLFARCAGEPAGPIATLNSSKCAVSAKEVPFGGLNDKKYVWGQNPKKNENFGGGNRRFKPNLQNFQIAISPKVVVRLR